MTTYPPMKLHNTFFFGKYTGEGVGNVIKKDLKYVKWILDHGVIEFDKEVVDKIKEIENEPN